MKKKLLSILLIISIFLTALAVPAAASEPLVLTVDSVTAEAGKTVDVNISVSNNTGLASLKFDVAYDEALTLTKVTFNSAFGSMITAPEPFVNPEPLTMISPLEDVAANGVFATLTFAVSDDVADGYQAEITVTYDEDDIYNGNYDNVATTVVNGVVTITVPTVCPHTFDNACDTSCNVCGETRTVGAHVYDDKYDPDCNECGDVREVADPNAPAFVVENKTAKAGDTFTVAVSTKNNSGITSLKLKLGYDADLLELISIEEADFASPSFSPLTKNPITINWEDVLSPNNTTNGTIAVLTFKVKETATECDTEITITYDPEDVYDENFDNVEFAVENGTITIIEYISGDVNDDGRVNNKDLGVLRQYLNDWDVTVDLLAADVNRDGKVNNKDLGILRQYLNDWDVVLK